LKKHTEIELAKKNGFTIFGKDADPLPTIGVAYANSNNLNLDSLNVKENIKKVFPNPDGKYKGFSINSTEILKLKSLIDYFRDEKFFGKVINHIDYSKETTSNKCRGFNPVDFLEYLASPAANYGNHLENMDTKDGQVEIEADSFYYSKMAIDA